MPTRSITSETRLSGLPISGGVAVGRVCRFNEHRHRNFAVYRVSADEVQGEIERVRRAVALAIEEIDGLIETVSARIGAAEAKIFEAQKAIVADDGLMNEVIEDLNQNRVNAETAVSRVLDAYESQLLELDNVYLKERASDIGEMRRRLLDLMGNTRPSLQCADETHCQRGRDRVVATSELTAGMTVELDLDQTKGFVTERGGPTSHAAILARSLGIPAVSGLKGIHGLLGCGTELLVNGNTGEVIVWPDEEAIAAASSAREASLEAARVVDPIPNVTVMANIGRASEVHHAVAQKAEGIGLYRTEFEFFSANAILDEEQQYSLYARVVQAMEGRPVCCRLLDIGGDKQAVQFDLPEEENPYLGLRGSRLLLDRVELVRPQARALARASVHGPVDVLYPMIIDVEQFLRLRQLFCDSIEGLTVGSLRHGVMFEVPSACLVARELLEVADFGSIGTNDLIQYLFAVDRNNALVSQDCTPDRPAFWAIVKLIVAAAAETGKTVSVCGEAANNLPLVAKMIERGLTTFSVSSRFIPELRRAVR
ncbi:MAG: phosphoenolpyruvate--protein phosphotransferase [Planctomycetota bacterium]